MSETLELRDLRSALRRRWWIPALVALAGVGLGLVAAADITPVYRAQGTLLAGPVSSTDIRSTTLRASESLASFYADLARRQVVLQPVTKALGLSVPWDELRNRVSAVPPSQNPRLITVTVLGSSPGQTKQIADQILKQLVSLSPAPTGGTEQDFVTAQTAHLKQTIQQGERQTQLLQARLAQSRNPQLTLDLRSQLTASQRLLNDWRHTYVELSAIDVSNDAGVLQVIDDVTAAKSSNASGIVGRSALAGTLGAALGVIIVWLVHRRRRAVVPVAAAAAPPVGAPVIKAEPERVPTAKAESRMMPTNGAPRENAPVVSPTQIVLGEHRTASVATSSRG